MSSSSDSFQSYSNKDSFSSPDYLAIGPKEEAKEDSRKILSKSIRMKELPELSNETIAMRKISDQALVSDLRTPVTEANKFKIGFEHFREKWNAAQQSLSGHKTFMNMIIHDMRNPTSQIKHAANNSLVSLDRLASCVHELKMFLEDEKVIKQKVLELMDSSEEVARAAQEEKELIQRQLDTILEQNRINQALTPLRRDGTSYLHYPQGPDLALLKGQLASCLSLFQQGEDADLASELLRRVEVMMSPSQSQEQAIEQAREPKQRLLPRPSFDGFALERHLLLDQEELKEGDSMSLDEGANASFDSSKSSSLASDKKRRFRKSKTPSQIISSQNMNTPKLMDHLSVQCKKNQSNSTLLLKSKANSAQRQKNSCCIELRSVDSGLPSVSLNTSVLSNNLRRISFNTQNLSDMLSQSQVLDKLRNLKLKFNSLSQKWQNNIELKALQLSRIENKTEGLVKTSGSCDFSSSILLNLINDLLDLAKAENNKFTISNDFFDLSQAVKEAKNTMEFLSESKHIPVTYSIMQAHAQELTKVFGDEGRLKQVLVNLLSNALKFTGEGGQVEILVKLLDSKAVVSLKQEAPDLSEEQLTTFSSKNSLMHQVQIEIKDTGHGISPEGMKGLFRNFSSLMEHQSVNSRGTGLGLSICKHIIERMNGTISASSELGKGTTFSIVIPFLSLSFNKEDSQTTADIIDHYAKGQRKKLGKSRFAAQSAQIDKSISENNAVSGTLGDEPFESERSSLESNHLRLRPRPKRSQQLRKRPTDGEYAETPKFAIDSAPHLQESQNFSMFAFHHTDRRGHERQIDVSEVDNSDEYRHMNSGPNALLDALGENDDSCSSEGHHFELLPGKKASGKVSLPKVSTPSEKKGASHLEMAFNMSFKLKKASSQRGINDRWGHLRVLLVNDEPVGLMMLEQMLRDRLGIEMIETAFDGSLAVAKAKQSQFDLIIMDLNMPVMDGFEATTEIKKNENSPTVVVALSASIFTESLIQRCSEVGFSGWLSTPVDINKLEQDVLSKYFK